ncbi:MAG TPA: hypothetical protein VMJ32_14980 [Pirellulales bacterium]|nr:hypothetical protein [Pirellulales bacterium]
MQPTLDEAKRKAICAILSVGGTRRMAARFVGCAERTIRNTAARDPAFRRALKQTDVSPEITFLKTLFNAASDAKHWQAAKWALQHIYPERYARRPQTFTIDQTKELLSQMIQSIDKAIPDEKTRAAIRRKIRILAGAAPPSKRKRRHVR